MIKFSALASYVALTFLCITSANSANIFLENQEIYAQVTKAECLKKKGYVWNPETGKCVKQTRGSY